jgi:hypothetical protein
LSLSSAQVLNNAILSNVNLKSLKLNFFIYKDDIFTALMPAFSQAQNLVSLDLSANGFGDKHCHLLARII